MMSIRSLWLALLFICITTFAWAQTFGSPQLVITANKNAHITTDTTTLI